LSTPADTLKNIIDDEFQIAPPDRLVGIGLKNRVGISVDPCNGVVSMLQGLADCREPLSVHQIDGKVFPKRMRALPYGIEPCVSAEALNAGP
jgi:hypothetical protein